MSKKRIIVVGGLSAGPSAAAKARRTNEEVEILLFEKTSHISYATCGIPYALSGKIKSRDNLMVVAPQLLKDRFDIDVHLDEPVISINTENKTIATTKGEYSYDKLIFATGGRAVVPPIENLDKYPYWSHAKTIEDYDRMLRDGVMDEAQHITLVGAGLIGLETAENLIHLGKKVTVIEFGNQVLGNWEANFAKMAEKVIEDNRIDLMLNTYVKAVDTENGALILNNDQTLATDFMMIAASIKPNTELLVDKGAKVLPNGALIVNEKMETSLPDIYAAGDCASINDHVSGEASWFPMGTHSNKGGRVAGANAAGANETFKGGYGTAIMKLFDYTIARTGHNSKALQKRGVNYEVSLTITGATPGFFPDQKEIITELYFEKESGKLLGAELFGEHGVDKRVDVLSTAIYAGLSIHDLPNLDLAYAPPYAPAKDPVIVAGYVAQNASSNNYEEWGVSKVLSYIQDTPSTDYTLLDVRNPEEIAKLGKITGSINIPLHQLRDRMGEIDQSKDTVVYCAKGMRGYLASLILAHHQFTKVKNIGGGFKAWKEIVH